MSLWLKYIVSGIIVSLLLPFRAVTTSFNIGLWGGGNGDIRVEIPPKDGQADVLNNNQEFITPDVANDSLLKGIQLANETLWIILAPVLMGMIIYGGFLILTSQWDAAKFKQGIRVIIYTGVGVGVVLLAYVVINLVINLF